MSEEEIYLLEETPYYGDTHVIGYTKNKSFADFWMKQAGNATASTRVYYPIKDKSSEIASEVEMSQIKYDEEN